MVTVEQVKDYLHIPYDDDDTYLSQAIDGGYGYLNGSIDDYETHYSKNTAFAAQADLWVLTQWMPSMYDEREGMHSNYNGLNYAARAMLTQMQLMAETYETEENND